MPARILKAVVFTAAVNAAVVFPAHAYIDPGTGTMLLQIAGAVLAAGLFYLRSIRLWLARRLGLAKAESVERPSRDSDEPER